MENTLTVAELKRRGMAAIEEGLRRGPVRIIKRNRPAAVVLSESDYQRLIGAQSSTLPGLGALQWLLAQPVNGGRSKADVDRALSDERGW